MAITVNTQQVSVNKTYTEKIEERTRSIRIDIPVGEQPRIIITRETVVYHDDVVLSATTTKRFEITLADLTAINKLGLMQEIADAIDAIAPHK
jgi:hypothetical protein